jgi:hypothetical protein
LRPWKSISSFSRNGQQKGLSGYARTGDGEPGGMPDRRIFHVFTVKVFFQPDPQRLKIFIRGGDIEYPRDGKRPITVPIVVKPVADRLHEGSGRQKLHIPEIGGGMKTEILVRKVASPEDGRTVVHDQHFVVHAVIETGKLPQVHQLTQNHAVVAAAEGIVDSQAAIPNISIDAQSMTSDFLETIFFSSGCQMARR